MHDWGDEDYIKILKSCRKVIPETRKLVIVDVVVLDSNRKGDDNNNGGQKEKPILDPNLLLVFDLVMVAQYSGGKERTKKEWKKILLEGGFGCYKIITIPDFQSVIEVFPSWLSALYALIFSIYNVKMQSNYFIYKINEDLSRSYGDMKHR